MRPWQGIITHHSATPDGETFSWGPIRRYHMSLGWRDIGYHFGVELIRDEGNYEILVGRDINMDGAHTRGKNDTHIGVCLVGNYDAIPPLPEQLEKLRQLYRWLMEIYSIPKDMIEPHRLHANKTCPGTMFDHDAFVQSI